MLAGDPVQRALDTRLAEERSDVVLGPDRPIGKSFANGLGVTELIKDCCVFAYFERLCELSSRQPRIKFFIVSVRTPTVPFV